MKPEILSSKEYEEYFDRLSLVELIKDCEIDLNLEPWEDMGNLEIRIKRILDTYYHLGDPSGESPFALAMEMDLIEVDKVLNEWETHYNIPQDRIPNNLDKRLNLMMAFARREIFDLNESLNSHLSEIFQFPEKDLALKDKLELVVSKYREKAIENLFINEIEAHEKSLSLVSTNYPLYVRFTKVIAEYKRMSERSHHQLNQTKQDMLHLIDALALIVGNGITGTHREKEAQLQGLKAILEVQRAKINSICDNQFF